MLQNNDTIVFAFNGQYFSRIYFRLKCSNISLGYCNQKSMHILEAKEIRNSVTLDNDLS